MLEKGYQVIGSSRDAELSSFGNLSRLGIRDQVDCISLAINDFRSTLNGIIQAEPDEIYNLAGQSSVGLSFQQPAETHESINLGTLNLLEALRFVVLLRFLWVSRLQTQRLAPSFRENFHPFCSRACGYVGARPESVGNPGSAPPAGLRGLPRCLSGAIPGLSTRPVGLGPVRRTRPHIHRPRRFDDGTDVAVLCRAWLVHSLVREGRAL
ncbi:GDP-mannose 4,6-dehydratase [Rhabdochromatium marinum]|uniref:GDP-mannose 4,6-dehydratase n=1 Tax=Rhabdochromatium marinum TaxID=48729 RepID=UPI001F5BB74A